jgi:O-antigen ligase
MARTLMARTLAEQGWAPAAPAAAPIRRLVLLSLFVVLLADEMFGWGLGLAPGVSIKNAFLYLLLLTLALEFAAGRTRHPLETYRVNLPFLLLIGWASYSWLAHTLLETGVPYRMMDAFIVLKGGLIDYYLFFLAFFLGVRTREDVLWLMRWLMLALIAANVVTLMDVYNLPDLGIIDQRHGGRVSGPLGEPNQYGAFVTMFLPISVAMMVGASRIWKLVFGFGALVLAWVLVITVSRGAFIGLIVGAGVAAFMLRKHLSARQVAIVTAGASILFITVLALVGEEFLRLLDSRTVSLTSRFDPYEASSGRTWIWAVALSQQFEQPLAFLFGFGWNTYLTLNPLNSHNTYLTFLFELGILGLLLYLALIVSLLRTIRLAAAREADRALATGTVLGLAAVFASVFFVNLFDPWYFIWAFAGLMVRLALLPAPTVEAAPAPVQDRWQGMARAPPGV